jgi:hypothetical protein
MPSGIHENGDGFNVTLNLVDTVSTGFLCMKRCNQFRQDLKQAQKTLDLLDRDRSTTQQLGFKSVGKSRMARTHGKPVHDLHG